MSRRRGGILAGSNQFRQCPGHMRIGSCSGPKADRSNLPALDRGFDFQRGFFIREQFDLHVDAFCRRPPALPCEKAATVPRP